MGLGNMVFGIVGLPLFAHLGRRLGKRRALASALLFSILMYVSTWWLYDPSHPWLLPLTWGLVGMGAAGIWMLFQSILADVMDYDELETGMRREGAFNACTSWLVKAAIATGTAVSGLILSLIGFDARLGGGQSAHALLMMRLLLPAVPVVGLSLSLYFVLKIPLTHEKMIEIRRVLEQRRGQV
jgi:GPH family glycoside/pentoside/hexuronide:cation symporter